MRRGVELNGFFWKLYYIWLNNMRYRWLGLAKVCHPWWLKTNVFYSELCNHITVLNCLLTWTPTNCNYGNRSHLYHPSHMMWTKHQSALEALPPFLSDSRAAVCKISRKRQIVNASSIHNSEGFISTWQEPAPCSWLSGWHHSMLNPTGNGCAALRPHNSSRSAPRPF